jgi:Flagellar hook-length control protein FliK
VRALDSASAEALASPGLASDSNGGCASNFSASVPVGVMVVEQQTHFAPVNRLSPVQRIAQSRQLLAAPDLAPSDPVETARLSDESATLRDIVEPQANQGLDPDSGHESDGAAFAVVRGLVVSQQMHAAPLHGPAQQIAKSVVAEAGPGKPDGGAATTLANRAPAPEDAVKSSLSVSRVQTMQLQLDPEILGKVTVKMRLSGARLELRVEAERLETMQLIGRDKDLLAGKLHAAGLTIESLVLQTAEPPASQPSGPQANGHNQSTGQTNGGPSSHDCPTMQEDRQRSRPQFADEPQDGADTRRRSGDLYL